MLDVKLANIYVSLWDQSDQSKPSCWALYQGENEMAPFLVPGEMVCVFMTHLDADNPEPEPRIWVQRDRVPADSTEADPAGATIEELISLAHERGHETSWRAGTYVPTQHASDRVAAMAEEHRAWNHARELLDGLGFDEWATFEMFRAKALRSYETATSAPER